MDSFTGFIFSSPSAEAPSNPPVDEERASSSNTFCVIA
ncbi:pheromone-like peptide [Fomitiporia mediterranea MF3/22]|nr:pheromone-like peptide [Fomitiporia mediterranea MF3/22]EJD05412.1 pheromone-like peptide [Fomitiporia mediterranea MF3/22]